MVLELGTVQESITIRCIFLKSCRSCLKAKDGDVIIGTNVHF